MPTFEPTKLNYTHEALADAVLANPHFHARELAVMFQRTPAWVSYVMNSDAFQALMAKRRAEVITPMLALTVDERLRGLAAQSADVVMEKLHTSPTGDFALSVLQASTKALGYGARGPQVSVENNFVVALPSKAANAEDWSRAHNPIERLKSAIPEAVGVQCQE